MTAPEVKVIQQDREAAATAYCKTPMASEQAHSNILNGYDDGHYLVQLFARHRTDAVKDKDAAIAALAKLVFRAQLVGQELPDQWHVDAREALGKHGGPDA